MNPTAIALAAGHPASKGRKAQPIAAAELPDALLTIKIVGAVTGLSASSIYRKTATGDFPQPVRLGSRCTRWPAGAVKAWVRAQVGE